ncbi:3-mercaptopyruvate sulfurtransferase [Alphaproteobacteria bacterium SO-S41]|nr:3-mercaptopyruvate sulfurtransferase [Alphaproteobacteria bacterium SO-S41]
MPSTDQPVIVTSDWLKDRLGSPDIRIIDASWHMPAAGRSGAKEFDEAHIPGALFFDIDEIADTASSLAHMLPPPEKFSARVRKLGIGDGTMVVAYDAYGMHAAARAWWMFRAMGHENVAVLDGGFLKWRADGLPVTTDTISPFQRHFVARPNWSLVRSYGDVRKIVDTHSAQIVDARPAGRFAGTEPEPRAGLRGGHMPGALNLPSASLLRPDGTLKRKEDILRAFAEAGVDLKKPIVTSCGSGVTACVPLLALASIGLRDGALYDGSWTEWGGRPDAPVETSA